MPEFNDELSVKLSLRVINAYDVLNWAVTYQVFQYFFIFLSVSETTDYHSIADANTFNVHYHFWISSVL